MEIDWAAWIMPAISGACGVGLAWGAIRQRVEINTRRIDKIESKLEMQVGDERCNEFRKECQIRIEKGFDKVDKHLTCINEELRTIAVWMAKHNGE